ncbi:glycosyltransferase family 2 protein [Rhodohalobacter sulfatireducens]|uniref:Glycosyltransferase n=1 Tax=Rhodohalobacter sulfatireducens TaxID=2911366 RepID=A0ABS9KIV3_9BACT|nr:glycosyltransferase family 2 protein [Rhodohalobacter sulfatireducens]MCG2590776.1 glycosyltransferase [Rhodohalobacter sulfatireducens]
MTTENQELVSVVLPTYNRVSVVDRAIKSVFSQTYNNWELLIVDDGSTDGTQMFIENKYGDDQRIQFLNRPSNRAKGANACRNIGIEHARGSYIAFLDSDDRWTKEHLTIKLNYLINNKADAVFSGFYYQRNDRMIPRNIKEYRGCKEIGGYIYEKKEATSTPTIVCKRIPCLNIKFDEELQKHQDRDFVIRFDQFYKIMSEPSLTVHVFTDSTNRISLSINHESTNYFLKKHATKLSSDALGNFYVSIAKATILREGKSEDYYKYREQIFSLAKKTYWKNHMQILDIPLLGPSVFKMIYTIFQQTRKIYRQFKALI